MLDVDGYLQPFVSFVDELIGGSYIPSSLCASMFTNAGPCALIDGLAHMTHITEAK